jgi:DNA-binding XRE family transcriptional regulator
VETASVGARIKQHREELGLSLSRLSELANVSKGYLWSLEKGESKARPSGDTVYRIARALGVTMSDLLGRKLLTGVGVPAELPPGLADFAKQAGLPQTDVAMLAQVNFRGEQPQTIEDWEFVYRAIQRSVPSGQPSARRPAAKRPGAPAKPGGSRAAG